MNNRTVILDLFRLLVVVVVVLWWTRRPTGTCVYIIPGIMRVLLVLCLVLIGQAAAWDSSDFEIFDAVEDINANFYEVLGVAPVCNPILIRLIPALSK